MSLEFKITRLEAHFLHKHFTTLINNIEADLSSDKLFIPAIATCENLEELERIHRGLQIGRIKLTQHKLALFRRAINIIHGWDTYKEIEDIIPRVRELRSAGPVTIIVADR